MTTSTAPGQLLGSVLSLARQASKAILDVYSTSFKVDIKTDDSVADLGITERKRQTDIAESDNRNW